nr:aminotransferase [uncultured Gellertiella sp.]
MSRFNPLVERLNPPAIPTVLGWGRAYDGHRGKMIDLSQAVPGYPPHPDMLRFLSEAALSLDNISYGPIEGEPGLRAAYATYVTEAYGTPVAAKNIHITAGANQAFIATCLATMAHGDTIATTNPFYFNEEISLSMLGMKVRQVDCTPQSRFIPDLEAVRAAIDPSVKAFVLVTPNNPTGAIYPEDLLEGIFDICRENGCWLILDETYRDFLPQAISRPHGLFARPDWDETLIGLYSFSKSFCIPGQRMGAITASPELVAQVAKVMDNLQICAPRAAQAAVTRALPALAVWRQDNRVEIDRRAAALKAVMARAPDWRMDSLGAYFAFIRHPFPGVPAAVVAERLARDAGVLCVPGSYFGAAQNGYLRFAFANADAETILLLAERLNGFSIN